VATSNLHAGYFDKRVFLIDLLQSKSIRSELNFTPEQTKAFVKIDQEYKEKINEGQAKWLEKIKTSKDKNKANSEIFDPIYEASDESFRQILNPDQIKRLEEIQRLKQGHYALAKPTVIQSLKLTDEQKALFKSIADDAQEEVLNDDKEFRKRFPSDFYSQELKEAMTAGMTLRVTVDRWALKMMVSHLTAEQKKAWQDLIGKPFTFPRDDPGIGPDLPPQK
jgi:hypothetical protein